MPSDPLQEAWQSQPDPTPDADRLVREVRQHQQQFAAMILLRDVREVFICLVLLPVWVGMGVGIGLPWTWYLVIPGIVWIAAFMTTDRVRQGRRRAGPGEPLVRGVESSLADVEHQIWLLRNVLWWYQLPLAVPMLAFFAHVFWQLSGGNLWEMTVATSLGVVIVGGFNGWIYWINQKAVRSTLEPRRQELAAMLQGLSDESPAPSNT
ncbi:hypothetical protein J0H58_22755 [bacterium]|nr:hypothetical protein [bacterium]